MPILAFEESESLVVRGESLAILGFWNMVPFNFYLYS